MNLVIFDVTAERKLQRDFQWSAGNLAPLWWRICLSGTKAGAPHLLILGRGSFRPKSLIFRASRESGAAFPSTVRRPRRVYPIDGQCAGFSLLPREYRGSGNRWSEVPAATWL